MSHENRFYEALEKIFVGAPIEGEGGYVNLLKIKEKYYQSVLSTFKEKIKADPIINSSFRENFFELLFNFFEKYFSECGSVYFVKTANSYKVYEKVYNDSKDVSLFWKTHSLYYVKSDILFQSIHIVVDDFDNESSFVFYFDVGQLKQKQNNEKKELLYEFVEAKTGKVKGVHKDNSGDKTFIISVSYSERGRKTNFDELASSTSINKAIIEKAVKVFEKQTSVDFFINKNADAFLKEQLDIFIHQYLLDEKSDFDPTRLNQLKAFKNYSSELIDFISQFENELVRIWNKPKFVTYSNYVFSFKTLKEILDEEDYKQITKLYFDRIQSNLDCKRDIEEIIRETYKRPLSKFYVSDFVFENECIHFSYFLQHENEEKALKKFKGITPDFWTEPIFDKGSQLPGVFTRYDNPNKYVTDLRIDELYMDTKYLSEEEKTAFLTKVTSKTNLDDLIDGYIVKSDNYQFLKSANKFKNRINCVYIDPPFNTETEGFQFLDGFKDTTWLSLMQDRFELIYKKFMSNNSSLYVHGDHHCNYYMRLLLDDICGQDNFNREIIWNTSPAISGLKAGPRVKNYIRQHDTILYYEKGKPVFNKLYREYKNDAGLLEDLGWLDCYEDENEQPYIYKYNGSRKKIERIDIKNINTMALGDVWNDVYSMMYSQNMTRENWGKSNTQKPENLVRRFIQVSSNLGDWVMDIFVGSGTTIAAAHKLGRKWIGVDSGSFIDDIVVKRMKSVVMGDFMPKLSEDLKWPGGGAFKYYSLEQYEDTLKNTSYNANSNSNFNKSVFKQYVFFADDKLSKIIEKKNDNIFIDIKKIYPTVDIPETISLLVGKPIEKIDKDFVYLSGYDKPIKYNVDDMNNDEKLEFIQLIKNLIWWGE